MSRRGTSPDDLSYPSRASRSARRDPDDEVLTLIERASRVETFSPSVSSFMDSNKDAFLDLLGRHIQLIKSRSQAFEDGHVTVYDKTLLSLSGNGKDLYRPAVVQYYCEDFLGLSPEASSAETGRILQQEVEVSKTVTGNVSLGMTNTDVSIVAKPERKSNTFPASQRKDMEPKLARLWGVYETARADYLALADKNNDEAMNAAKFLRDTAENTLGYLKNKNFDPIMLVELNATFEMAKATAVSLAGGKKRKFDPVDMDDVKGTPRAPSNFRRRSRPRKRGGANRYDPFPSSDSGYGAMRHPYEPISPSTEMMSAGYDSRATDTYTYTHPPASTSPRSRGPPPVLDPQRPRGYGRAPVPMRGRGHGTVPYGYSRGVDSYHPDEGAHGRGAFL